MKFLLSALFLLTGLASYEQGIRRYPGKNDGDGYFTVSGSGMVINPGDTVVLQSSVVRTYLALIGYAGTAANKIVIVNEGGYATLTRGLGFESCQHIKVIGNTVPGFTNGIRLWGLREGIDVGAAQGINITKKSSDIEVAYVDFKKGTYGIEAKNDADADTSINNWVLRNFNFHHLVIDSTGSQGMYLGNTDPDNFDRGIVVNSVTIFPKPSKLAGLKAEFNNIQHSGRANFQLSGHEVDTAYVANNIFKYAGGQLNDQQGANLSLGGNTLAKVYNNTLSNSYTWNISAFGVYYLDMQNNALDSTNWYSATQINPGFYPPFAIQTRPQKAIYGIDSTRFKIVNNTFARSRIRETGTTGAGEIVLGQSVEDTYYKTPGSCVVGNTYTIPNPDIDALIFAAAQIVYSTTECVGAAPPPIVPPTAYAGMDVTTTASSVALSGTGAGVGTLIYTWTKISGTGTTPIANPNNQSATASGLVIGTYVFRLTVQDNNSSVFDEVIVTVVSPAPEGYFRLRKRIRFKAL